MFVVVTDDMAWAEQNLNIPGMRVAFLGHTEVTRKGRVVFYLKFSGIFS